MLRTGGGRSAALACALAAAAVGCSDGGDATESEPPAREPSAERPAAEPTPPSGVLTEPAEPGPPESAEEDEAVEAALSYLAAIDSRDAARACGLLAPGALESVRGVPGPCVKALAAALGRRARGGAPDWAGTRVERQVSVVVEGDRARVTLEVFHRFSDRRNPSVEDDVIFLELRGGRWLVSQADATLYRAVGYPEPPLRSYLAPAG